LRYPFLIGQRIYLRGFDRSDLEGNYVQWLNDRTVSRWMDNGHFPNSMESLEAYYKSVALSRDRLFCAIALKDGDRHIGNISLHTIHSIFRSAEIGILIGEKDVWGQGIGTEAICLIAEHGFMRLNLNRLYAGAVEKNIGCIRAFEKAGFVREGRSRQAHYCEGQYFDYINLSLLRSEWLGKHPQAMEADS
jgi:[ribosomal protein S5]-alanine N-acetyltransferase